MFYRSKKFCDCPVKMYLLFVVWHIHWKKLTCSTMCLKCGWSVEIPWKNCGSRVPQFFPFPQYRTQAEYGISVVIVWNQNVELMWKLYGILVIIIIHIEWILCGTSVEFLHSTLWNIRSTVWNMEFHNVELVWNSEFRINEKASEIKQCTGIHDYSSTMCLKWVLRGGMW